ncbi:MAG: L-fucose dehydrogenase [Cytophagaceae bacterium]|nr:L-fucose dehydrogenase [Cytophagaceae bacterium]
MNSKENKKHYQLPHDFGMGGVSLGNEFEPVTDEEAHETLKTAWDEGVRYYDVAPWYGLGLSERRYGYFLHNKPREEYVISSKVGKLLKASKNVVTEKGPFPFSPSPNSVTFDYSASGIRRSIEDSLQRLGIDSLDIAYVHDLSSDNPLFKEGEWLEHFEVAKKGAFPELTKMREEGIIKGWGLGVNTPEPIMKALDVADPDIFLFAAQYSLMDHENAIEEIFPAIRKHGASLVMGSNLNAGYLSGSDRYNYGPKIPDFAHEKREKLRKIAAAHNVDLRTAALQFASFPDVATAIVPGMHTPQQVKENLASMKTKIPADFWQELKDEKLIHQDAPTENQVLTEA